jgi:hypothetical protein
VCPSSKIKYFLDGDLLHALPAANVIYLEEHLKGVEVLKAGIVWRIGNGSNINIWNDPWLTRETSRRPITPRGQTLLSEVSDLINPIQDGGMKNLFVKSLWIRM